MTQSFIVIIQTIAYSKKWPKNTYIEKVAIDYDRPCHIRADVTVNVTQNDTVFYNIITSGGNGGFLIITFLISKGGGAL